MLDMPKVGQDRIDMREAVPGEDLLQAGEIRVVQMKRMPDRFEAFSRLRQVIGVHVGPMSKPVEPMRVKSSALCPAPADGAIHDGHTGPRIEDLQDFSQQHRAMLACGVLR